MGQPEFIPVNQLEEILVAACTDPSARPEFYRLLAVSELFLLTADSPAEAVRRTLQTSEQVSFVHLQNAKGPFLPIFTSQDRLQAAVNQLGQTYGCMALLGTDLFPILAQHPPTAILNPGLPYGKELTDDEICRIANGSILKTEQHVVQKATQVLLGQPAKYPHELVAALSCFFEKKDSVHAAYLAQIHDPSRGDKPHLIIGLEVKGDFQTVAGEAGMIARDVSSPGEIVDFIEIGGKQGSLDSYFKQKTKPFYQAAAKKPFWKVW